MIITNGKFCVYIHTNKINGKKYVGQTCRTLEKRYNWGFGYKHSRYFYNAIQKYGWDNFEHEVIASNLTKEEADNFERLLIEKLNTQDKRFGYNLKKGGANGRCSEETKHKISVALKNGKAHNLGKHLSETTKQRISKNRKGKMMGKNHPNAVKVLCIETNTLYDSLSDAERQLGVSHAHISQCCKGTRKTAGGYHWRYA